jgi:predicted RNA binding protein YcfA (HicA-like mRNA interferase family)
MRRRGETGVGERACFGPRYTRHLERYEGPRYIKLLQEDGWYLKATNGSHRQYKHSSKPGRVTLPGHPNDDLAPGTLNSVLKQAGLRK